AALIADQKRIAIGEVARAGGAAVRRDQPPVGVVRVPGGDALGDDAARGVLAEMQHLCAGIYLLIAVGDGDRIEFATRILTTQDAAWIFPRDRRAGLELRPGDLRVLAAAIAPLGDEIVDAAAALGVARIPVLNSRIFDFSVVERNQFDHSRVQLIFITDRGGAAFEVAHIGAAIGDDQRT